MARDQQRWVILPVLCVIWGCQSTPVSHNTKPSVPLPSSGDIAAVIPDPSSPDASDDNGPGEEPLNPQLAEMDSKALTQYLDTHFPEDKISKYDFPVVRNDLVDKWIGYFTGKGRDWFQAALSRGMPFIPVMKEILENHGLPGDLVYLALIESGFREKIQSRAKAVGQWQFIKATGRKFGLDVDVWVDERRDPLKATEAAARYLNTLHDIFNSYYLALGAYNAGPARILKAITKHKTRDFWELCERRRALPRETRNYVPKLIAAIILAKNAEKFGFTVDSSVEAYTYATVTTENAVNLIKLANHMGIAPQDLRELNSELKYAMTPPGKKGYELKVPPELKEKALAGLAHAAAEFSSDGFTVYSVKHKDTLYRIARKFGTRVSTLMEVNHLSYTESRNLKKGRQLIIPVPEERGLRLASLHKNKSKHLQDAIAQTDRIIHTVGRGESLWSISRKYRTTLNTLMEANKHPKVIKPGQKLIIPKTI